MEIDKNLSSNKRKRDEEDTKQEDSSTRKCVVQEGFSWWTCLMYDMPQSKSKPQPTEKKSTG